MKPRPRRRFGQHFLEPAWVDKLIPAIDPGPEDTFLEIGPGRGALTRPLAARCARVTAVEIDTALAAKLSLQVPANVSIVDADVLTLDLADLKLPRPCRAVGNLPYNIASQILVRLLEFGDHGTRLTDATVMLQREVADRVTGNPGSRDWGPLAIATRLSASASVLMNLPPGAFRPMPKVRSTLIRLDFRPAPVTIANRPVFDALVRHVFTQRRKTVLNALKAFAARYSRLPVSEIFRRAGVDATRRPGQLDLPELAELAAVLAENKP